VVSGVAPPVSFLVARGRPRESSMHEACDEEAALAVRPVPLSLLGESYRRYRLADPLAEAAMAGSLRRWGQLSPVVACAHGEQLEVLDGFKRLAAAHQVAGWATLSVRVLDVDERTAKAAILGLNRGQRPVRELEEAWIVQALVRDDGLTQVEAAHLLGQHKSWVCRRLALLEKLSMAVKEDLRLGLLGPALARQLTRLPAGNQEAVLTLTRRQTLTAQEVSGVIDLLQGASPEQAAFVLAKPREALAEARGLPTALRDPRLSRAGNWLARHLAQALEALVRMEHWLRTPGERELSERDRAIVQPLLQRLGDQADVVAEQVLGPVRGVERGGGYGRGDAS
jgi:ParB-like chromosome segregation protein Spo0J